MHNVLSMSIARQLGMYASRTRYVEVVVNGSYQGVYVLMEKIKVDNDRVDIADLNETENTGDDLTGGYIIKIDKSTGNNLGSFVSNYPNRNGSRSEYFYHLPKPLRALRKIT
ncbi:MAG: CotH kinase family protein [Cytophagaceae bacterium]|nr:CotH kinase family protein [Cytophagaceae bacterium]